MLRLRQALSLIEARLVTAARALAELSEAEAETPMAARTYGQVAVPTSFGALVASPPPPPPPPPTPPPPPWGWPVLQTLERLRALKPRLCVSLAGAAAPARCSAPTRRRSARLWPRRCRSPIRGAAGMPNGRSSPRWAGLCVAVTATGAKPGEDLLILTRSDVAEVRLAGGGASSTMPQKQNPVGPSVLVALARTAAAQGAALAAPAPREARDGAAWFTEWLILPRPRHGRRKIRGPAGRDRFRDHPGPRRDEGAAQRPTFGLIHAETLSFGARLRPAAPRGAGRSQAAGHAGPRDRHAAARPFLVAAAHPEATLPPLTGPTTLGTAPEEARAFARAAPRKSEMDKPKVSI